MPPLLQSQTDSLDCPEEEAALWSDLIIKEGEGAQRARQRLFACHAPFARRVGRRIFRQRDLGDIDPADIDQLAYVGLMEALDRYDPSHGTPFPGFAAARIKGSVIDGITRMNDAREQVAWRHRMRRDRIRSLAPDIADTRSTEDALAALTEIALGLAVGFMLEGTGLYHDDNATSEPNGYESVVWKDVQSCLRTGLERLPETERWIITHHYLRGMAFTQLASVLRLSKGRVAQIHRTALERLGKFMRGGGHFRLEE